MIINILISDKRIVKFASMEIANKTLKFINFIPFKIFSNLNG